MLAREPPIVNSDAFELPSKINIFVYEFFPWVFSPKGTTLGGKTFKKIKKKCIANKDHPNEDVTTNKW